MSRRGVISFFDLRRGTHRILTARRQPEDCGPFLSDFTLRAYFSNVLANSWKAETITVNRAALAQLLALAERPHD